MRHPLFVAGHSAVRGESGSGDPLPHHADGSVIPDRTSGPGHAKCQCGEVSEESLGGGNSRQQWHRRHREEIAAVPWSDAAESLAATVGRTLGGIPPAHAARVVRRVLGTERPAPGLGVAAFSSGP